MTGGGRWNDKKRTTFMTPCCARYTGKTSVCTVVVAQFEWQVKNLVATDKIYYKVAV
jgi:hypothetical protein